MFRCCDSGVIIDNERSSGSGGGGGGGDGGGGDGGGGNGLLYSMVAVNGCN